MAVGFSKFCFVRNDVIDALKKILPIAKSDSNGCQIFFGDQDCTSLSEWTDGSDIGEVQVWLNPYSRQERLFETMYFIGSIVTV